jgi:hypothetical protein
VGENFIYNMVKKGWPQWFLRPNNNQIDWSKQSENKTTCGVG